MTPDPDPPEPPEPELYTFSITNFMSQSYYFACAGCQSDGTIIELSDVSSLVNQNSSAELTIPQGYEYYRVYASSVPEIASNKWFYVYVNGSRVANITPESGKDTFTVQYYGNNASTVGVWS